MNVYVIFLSHGEYEDHVEVPVAVAKDHDTACLIAEALNEREEKYIEAVKKRLGLWWDVISDDCTFDVFGDPVPVMEV